ncbi:hypothetical protein LOTGIDRAFT_167193 [Lottia gigantea]|uniref:Sushi domain-containing protein n=1 Tax=Lottia gigantea TaxID=225164 RepID=V4BDA5_LOTGI|nr:hypothetical protein LOTGIDRAFT_167193 [Lottia gigantea]ESO86369.1 hypothetical protein LOTGIDRAFT_167193 [Lottia gigantea]
MTESPMDKSEHKITSEPDPTIDKTEDPDENPFIFKTIDNIKTIDNQTLVLLEECQEGIEICSIPLMNDDKDAMFSICRSIDDILQCFNTFDKKCTELLVKDSISDITKLLQWMCQQLSEIVQTDIEKNDIPDEYLKEFGLPDDTEFDQSEKDRKDEHPIPHRSDIYNLTDNGILYVRPVCGNLTDNDPKILLLSDTTVDITAHCVNGQQKFLTKDFVQYQLSASLTPHQQRCQLFRKQGINTYTVDITIDNYILHHKTSIYTVTCTYDDYSSNITKIHHIIPGLYGSKLSDSYVSPVLDSSNVKLTVQNVLDQDLVNQPMTLDRKYSLFGTWIDTKSVPIGLRPVSCKVISGKNDSYDLLKAGCGDGIIFKQSEGFMIKGSTFRSPYFQGFHLSGSPEVTFQCTFATCSKVCDGSSCEINCGEPEIQITNAKLDSCTGYTFENECIYSCKDGYDQINDGIITCGGDGIWTKPIITCTLSGE